MAEQTVNAGTPELYSNDVITLKGKQFGRFVEVEIKDFRTATKLIIGNDFEVEFEFFKTVDESKQASMGRVVIYGLNTKTVEALQHEGGEITLRCGYEQLQIVTLFSAYITRFYTETANNTTVTTIECSANILDFYYTSGQYLGGKPSDRASTTDGEKATGMQLDASLYEAVKYYTPPAWQSVFDFGNVPTDRQSSFENYINTLSANTNFQEASYDSIFQFLCDYASMQFHRDNETKTLTFSFNDVGIMRAIEDIETGNYPKVSAEKMQYLVGKRSFESVYKTNSTSERVAIILDKATGLISNRVEYKIATAYADQQRNPNESETIESMRKRNDKAVNKKAKEEEAKRKAEKKGKEYKKKPEKFSRQKIRVNRLYQRITALLNPNVKPQTIVIVRNELRNSFDRLRVREITFRGNNRRNDWIMELYCEDTAGTYDADLTASQIAAIESEYSEGMATQGVVDSSVYKMSSNRMTNAQVRAMGWNHQILPNAITNPVKEDTVAAMKVLDEDGLGGRINAFTSITGGSHANGTYSHANGYKIDIDLNVGDNVEAYAATRQRAMNVLDRAGFKYEIWAEKDGWKSLGREGFRNGGGSHLDIVILGRK